MMSTTQPFGEVQGREPVERQTDPSSAVDLLRRWTFFNSLLVGYDI